MSMNDILYPSSYVRADINNIPTWYEFLLKDGLLIEHLSENDPEPSACMLIKQFFDQVSEFVVSFLLNFNINTFEKHYHSKYDLPSNFLSTG